MPDYSGYQNEIIILTRDMRASALVISTLDKAEIEGIEVYSMNPIGSTRQAFAPASPPLSFPHKTRKAANGKSDNDVWMEENYFADIITAMKPGTIYDADDPDLSKKLGILKKKKNAGEPIAAASLKMMMGQLAKLGRITKIEKAKYKLEK